MIKNENIDEKTHLFYDMSFDITQAQAKCL